MLVLHGFWAAREGLCLWAEDSELPITSTSHALRSARPHPFAAPASVLTSLHAGKPAEADLLLPSLRMAPLDSPELIRTTPRPAARSEPALLPWTVPIVMLYATPALAAIHERAPGVRYGASMDYLAGLAAFAGELVARGRVLPTLDHDGAGAVARWRPVIQGPDVTAIHALAAAMPPVCRALAPGHDDPHDVLTAALAALADAAAREALPAGLRLVPPRRGRRPSRLAAAEAWLTALTGADGRFDADPGELSALARALAPWEDIGTGKTGPARATFRLAEVTAEPDDGLFGADDADEPAGPAREAPGQPPADPAAGAPAAPAGDGGLAAADPGEPAEGRPEPGWRLE